LHAPRPAWAPTVRSNVSPAIWTVAAYRIVIAVVAYMAVANGTGYIDSPIGKIVAYVRRFYIFVRVITSSIPMYSVGIRRSVVPKIPFEKIITSGKAPIITCSKSLVRIAAC
jgi:hypothetical protein